MRIDVLTLFPEMFDGVLGSSILARASRDVPDPAAPDDPSRVRPAVASYHVHQLRDWSDDPKHARVDSPPYGGGPGMVLRCEPVWSAVRGIAAMDPTPPRRVLLTPKGRPLTQALCEELAQEQRLLLVAGHYEGLDQRVVDRLREDDNTSGDGGLLEVSVGDYVLSGGELPAMTLIDAVVRLLPGALGHAESAHRDSFSPGVARRLDHPHYTRPPDWQGHPVPDVLLSGDHAAIDAWRDEQSRRLTAERRPDLLSTGSDPSASTAPLIVIRDTGLPPPKAELDPLLAVHAAAFPTDAEAQLVRRLFAGHDVLFSVAADRDDQLVGHVLVSAMTHEHGGSVRGLAALAPLAVHPDHQRRGVGTALAREAVRQAREHRLAALFVLGDPDFYRPLGFRPAADHGYTPPESVPPEHHHAFQVLPFPHRRPVPPGRVRFAGPFDDLDN